MRYSGAQSVSAKSRLYHKFKGADFSTDPTQVDDSRSPWPLNLIADEGGFPEKRPGWRVLQSFPGRINGIFTLTVNGEVYWIVHHGTTCANVSDSAYVPRTVIARAPTGGGTTFEGVNLLSSKRQNDFLADGTATVYQLDADNIGSVVSVEVNGTAMTSGYTVDAGAGMPRGLPAAPSAPSSGAGRWTGCSSRETRHTRIRTGAPATTTRPTSRTCPIR